MRVVPRGYSALNAFRVVWRSDANRHSPSDGSNQHATATINGLA